MFVSKAEAYLSEATIRCFKDRLVALPKDSGPSWKGLPGTNTLAYHEHSKITDFKRYHDYKTFYILNVYLEIISYCVLLADTSYLVIHLQQSPSLVGHHSS